MSKEKITERFTKRIADSIITYCYDSEFLHSKVELQHNKATGQLSVATIKNTKNIFSNPKQKRGNLTKWHVSQTQGNSTREEFERAYKTAIELMGC